MPTRVYLIADRSMKGRLEDRLRRWRGQGISFSCIAEMLTDAGIPVRGESVRRWCMDLGIHQPASK